MKRSRADFWLVMKTLCRAPSSRPILDGGDRVGATLNGVLHAPTKNRNRGAEFLYTYSDGREFGARNLLVTGSRIQMTRMPKKRPSSTLEALLSHILRRAVQEIASAIKEAGASSVMATPAAAAPVTPAAKKAPAKKVGKAPAKKVRKTRASTPTVASPVPSPPVPVPTAPAASAPVKTPAKRATRKRATTSTGVNPVEKVLLVIRAEPGLRAEQIERLAELPKAAAQAALVMLRKNGRVKVQGKARGMMYTAV